VHDLGGQGVAAPTKACASTESDRTAEGIQATSPPLRKAGCSVGGHGPCIEGAKEKGYAATVTDALSLKGLFVAIPLILLLSPLWRPLAEADAYPACLCLSTLEFISGLSPRRPRPYANAAAGLPGPLAAAALECRLLDAGPAR
jgi:hypothetical protein